MKKETSSIKVGIGTPTLIMIFILLCMSILSLLAYQEAHANDVRVQKEIDYAYAYQQADTQAHKIQDALETSDVNHVETLYNVTINEDDSTYQYEVRISENRVLYVELDKNNSNESVTWRTQKGGTTND